MLNKGIYIVTGIMASGKSAIAQLLSEQFEQSVHVRGDLFRKMIVKGSIDMSPDDPQGAAEQLKLRYTIAAKVAESITKKGSPSFYRTSIWEKRFIPFLKALQQSLITLLR
ncbi:hypothetical protein VSK91_06115 [Bacillus swezeyi]